MGCPKAKYRHRYRCRIACFDDEGNDVACEWEGIGREGGNGRPGLLGERKGKL